MEVDKDNKEKDSGKDWWVAPCQVLLADNAPLDRHSHSGMVLTGLGQLSQVVFNKTIIVNSNANSLLTQSLRIFAEPHIGWWQEVTNPTGMQVDRGNLDLLF